MARTMPEKARGDPLRDHRLDRRADVRALHQRGDPDPRGGDLPRHRPYRASPKSATPTNCWRRCSARRSRRRSSRIALLCCGQNSTVTATLAGQIVMEGFLNIRLPAWAAAAHHPLVAIVPAVVVTIYLRRDRHRRAAHPVARSILSLQLPFAVIPLVMFTGDRRKMGALVAPRWLTRPCRRGRRDHRRAQRQAGHRFRVCLERLG